MKNLHIRNNILGKLNKDEKVLIDIQDIMKLTGFGQTKVRQILHREDVDFTVKVGNRIYADKELFIKWLRKCAKYKIQL